MGLKILCQYLTRETPREEEFDLLFLIKRQHLHA